MDLSDSSYFPLVEEARRPKQLLGREQDSSKSFPKQPESPEENMHPPRPEDEDDDDDYSMSVWPENFAEMADME